MATLISEAHAACCVCFEELIDAIKNPVRNFHEQAPLKEAQEEFDRYKLWAGNVGAIHSRKRYEISLEYRLRDASYYKKLVLKLLQTLEDTWRWPSVVDFVTNFLQIGNALSLLRGERKPFEERQFKSPDEKSDADDSDFEIDEQAETGDSPWEISSDTSDGEHTITQSRSKREAQEALNSRGRAVTEAPSSSNSAFLGRRPTREMPRIFQSLKFTVTCLYKLPIRRPAPLDRLRHKTSIDASPYQHFDVLHVADKFPQLDPEVVARLGKMISRRRQKLFYQDSHSKNLETDVAEPKAISQLQEDILAVDENSGVANAGMDGQISHTQVASSRYTLHTKATTLRPGTTPITEVPNALVAPSTAESKSSVASTYAGEDRQVSIPPRPSGEDGKPLESFECPYCMVAVVITTDRKWKKHVLADIQPYVCTFPDCSLLDHFFEDRDEWYRHELQFHRVRWFCNIDGHSDFEHQLDFLTHMKRDHDITFRENQLHLLSEMFQRPSRATSGQCNLCQRDTNRLKSHISQHLQQIALFALPRVNETVGSGQAEVDTRSSWGKKDEQAKFHGEEHDSQINQSNSAGEADQLSEKEQDLEDLKSFLDQEVDFEQVEVPEVEDAEISSWKTITDKLLKAQTPGDEKMVHHYVKEDDSFPWLREHAPAEIPEFNLDSAPHTDTFMRILKLTKTPQVTIHFEVLNGEPQKLTLYCPAQAENPPDVPISPVNSHPPPSESMYAIPSYGKILINAAFARLLYHDIYRYLGLSWQTPACDLFNRLRRSRGKSPIRRLWGNPGLRQLLLHHNGFAPMNRYLLAPDGTFVMSEEEFIQDGPRITEDRYRDEFPDRAWQEYSNGNHIFASMILEEITGRGLQEALQELLFGWLDLTHTIVSEAAFATTVNKSLVVGYHIASEKQKAFAISKKHLSDIIEFTSLGFRSSTEDIAKLNRTFLKSLQEETPNTFSKAIVTEFFRPDHKMTGGGAITLAGLFASSDSKVPGEESLNQTFRTLNNSPQYRLGRRLDGSSCDVYYKGGSVNGFTTSVYLLLNDRAFIIVLGNSSGPSDLTDYISRYILQEAFQLRPRIDVVETAERELLLSSIYIDRIADEDIRATTLSLNVRNLTGQYKHTRYTQQLTITPAGSIKIHGTQKSSSAMKLVYVGSNKVRILQDATPFGCERWAAWEDLEFFVRREADGRTELIGNRGKDSFRRV